MASKPVFHIEIDEETDYTVTLLNADPSTGFPIDLTGFSAVIEVRQFYDGYANPSIALMFTSDPESPLYGIILGGAEGTIQINIPTMSTSQLNWDQGVYDLILTSPAGVRSKFIRGFFTVEASVTRLENG